MNKDWGKFMKIKLCKILSNIFLIYLKLIVITGRLTIKNKELIKENSMVGYWHGDSFSMQLILREISKKYENINVIVTSDTRGNVIENMIKAYGAKAIRLPDGIKMRQYFRDLINFSKEDKGILALSFDGPTGPLYEPKKLLFILAAKGNKQVVYIRFDYKHVIRLKYRWDNYVIPLPFGKITATVEELGFISIDDVKNFESFKQRISH